MTRLGRRSVALLAAVAAAVTLISVPLTPAGAEPNQGEATEEGNVMLGDVLESTGKRYLEAKAALDASQKRQLELNLELTDAQAKIDELAATVGQVAAESYRQGRLTGPSLMLGSSSPDGFLDRMTSLSEMSALNDAKLHEYTEARDTIDRAKAAIDAEVAEEEKQLSVIDKQKKEAEKALALVGGTKLTGGFVSATSPKAAPAPRTKSGGWPAERCSEKDPTTSGCVTPRTKHAYEQVRKAGFTRFVGCYRSGGPYEHPKGRACDWSLRNSGFAPAANQDQKTYGNNLTAFLVRNADALGILYVIWYKQIWWPGLGWRAYSGVSDHTDHVHMSML